MRIKHYTLIVAFLAISMGIPLVQGCSDCFWARCLSEVRSKRLIILFFPSGNLLLKY